MAQLSLLFVQAKEEPQCLTGAIASLKEQNASVIRVERLENADEKIASGWTGVVVANVSSTDDIVPLLNFLRQHLARIKARQIRVIAFNSVHHDKLTALLLGKGCSELLDFSLQAKTFLFKLDKHFKFVKANDSESQSGQGTQKSETSAAAKESDELIKYKVQMVPPLAGNFDYWWIRRKADARKVFDRWSVELIGPSPNVGTWEKSPPLENGKRRGSVWRWKVKSVESPFYRADGEWIFFGEKPEFVWSDNRWRFRGESPALDFVIHGKAAGCRFEVIASDTLSIGENSNTAKAMQAQIVATFDQSYAFTADPSKPISQAGVVLEKEKSPDFNGLQSVDTRPALSAAPNDLRKEDVPKGAAAFEPFCVMAQVGSDWVSVIDYGETAMTVSLPKSGDRSGEETSIEIYPVDSQGKPPIRLRGKFKPFEKDSSVAVIELLPGPKAGLSDIQKSLQQRQEQILKFMDQAKGISAPAINKKSEKAPPREGTSAQDAIFLEFMRTNDILIVNSIKGCNLQLKDQLQNLGGVPTKIHFAESVESAKLVIKAKKPKLVLCEYRVGHTAGLDLIAEQRANEPLDELSENIFVLIAQNAHQAAVARAAEEDVDTFVIRPFTDEILSKCLRGAILSKIDPSPYLRAIHEGKVKIGNKLYREAIELLRKAQAIDEKAPLAFYYIAQAQEKSEDYPGAELSYKTGLSLNPIHFKSLSGLFELFQRLHKPTDAYDIIHLITQHFPENAKRLSNALRLAIVTNSFKDMEYYYKLYEALDPKTEEVTRYTFAAMSVTGRYYLQNKTTARAIEAFDRAVELSDRKSSLLRYVIEALAEYEALPEAESYLRRFSAQERSSADYLISQFIVQSGQVESSQILRGAYEMIKNGLESEGVYRVLIKTLAKIGKVDEAIQQSKIAQQKWPKNAERFIVKAG